jgi:hypothetical protein
MLGLSRSLSPNRRCNQAYFLTARFIYSRNNQALIGMDQWISKTISLYFGLIFFLPTSWSAMIKPTVATRPGR